MQVIITSPSLDPTQNVSGVSSVTQFIIDNNDAMEYVHFELGRKDKEKGGWRRIPAILCKLKEWQKVLKQYPEAIIHYNFPLEKPSILRDPLFMFIARKLKREMIIHVHGGIFLTSPSTPWLLKCIMRWVFEGKEPIIVLSDSEREALQSKFHCSNISILPNCINLSESEKFSRQVSTKTIELGYLGRITESKGMTELLEACIELQQQNVPFHLYMAGKEEKEGQYLPAYKENLGDRFIYEGVVSGKSKIDFLKHIDTFVLPSYFEGLPMSLLEAMSFACVPITTLVGSIPSIVTNKENGVAIAPHSSQSIVDAVKILLSNSSYRKALSQKAQQTIFKSFSPRKYINNLNNIYNLLAYTKI